MSQIEWNYRVVRQLVEDKEVFTFRKAYFEEDAIKPHAVNTEPVVPTGSSVKELYDELKKMLGAINLPMLEDGELPIGPLNTTEEP